MTTACRRIIGDHLSAAGFDVIVAPDTIMALRQLEAHPQTDLCLVHLVMPSSVPDGEVFAQSVRSVRPDMPPIPATGYSDAASELADMASGINPQASRFKSRS